MDKREYARDEAVLQAVCDGMHALRESDRWTTGEMSRTEVVAELILSAVEAVTRPDDGYVLTERLITQLRQDWPELDAAPVPQ